MISGEVNGQMVYKLYIVGIKGKKEKTYCSECLKNRTKKNKP